MYQVPVYGLYPPIATVQPITYTYSNVLSSGLSASSSVHSDSDEQIDLSGVQLYENPQVTYLTTPQPLSRRKYGLFADYIQPLYPEQVPVAKTNYTTTSYVPVGLVDPLSIPGAKLISDVIEVQQTDELVSDVIEINGDRSDPANLPYLFESIPPTKKLTKIITYTTATDSASESASVKEAKKKEKKEKKLKKKKSKKESKEKASETKDSSEETK